MAPLFFETRGQIPLMNSSVYSETSVIRTPLGPPLTVLFMEVSLFWSFRMYTCQCEGCQMGQSSGVLLKEVAAFWRCPSIEVSLYKSSNMQQILSMLSLCVSIHLYRVHTYV